MTGGRLILQAAAAFCQHGRAPILVAPRHRGIQADPPLGTLTYLSQPCGHPIRMPDLRCSSLPAAKSRNSCQLLRVSRERLFLF